MLLSNGILHTSILSEHLFLKLAYVLDLHVGESKSASPSQESLSISDSELSFSVTLPNSVNNLSTRVSSSLPAKLD